MTYLLEHEYDLREEDQSDITKLKSVNEMFAEENKKLNALIDILKRQIEEKSNILNMRDRYINDVIQPMIFQRQEKVLELDGICYELFAIVRLLTIYPENIHVMPVNMWNQICDELEKEQSYELLRDIQKYKENNPTKFTKKKFGECYYRGPLWTIPNHK